MSPTSFQLSEVSTALRTRQALTDVQSRLSSKELSAAVPSPASSPITTQTSRALPLVTVSGKPYTLPHLPPSQLFTVSRSLSPGTLLVYQPDGQKPSYAQVAPSPPGKLLVDNPISESKYHQIHSSDPGLALFRLTDSALTSLNIHQKLMLTVFQSLDPSENIVFKIITRALIGDIFSLDSIFEIFFGLYLRVIFIALVIIVIVSLTMRYL